MVSGFELIVIAVGFLTWNSLWLALRIRQPALEEHPIFVHEYVVELRLELEGVDGRVQNWIRLATEEY